MTDFSEAYRKVLPSVVGLGYRDNDVLQIIGSGFIVHSSGLVVSNRHVLSELVTTTPDGRTGVRPDASVFVFAEVPGPPGLSPVQGMFAVQVLELAVHPEKVPLPPDRVVPQFRGLTPADAFEPLGPDIGVCQFSPSALPPNTPPIRPAVVRDSSDVKEGVPVGILGFPQGMVHATGKMTRNQVQLCPILQTGVIAAQLPMRTAPDSFLLDILVNPGSSGSPLFLESGEIVGIVYAARVHRAPVEFGGNDPRAEAAVYVPTSLGCAVPSARLPKEWLTK